MSDMLTLFEAIKARYMGQKAQGMVEYALIIAFVVALAIALTNSDGLKGAISGVFGSASSQISATT